MRKISLILKLISPGIDYFRRFGLVASLVQARAFLLGGEPINLSAIPSETKKYLRVSEECTVLLVSANPLSPSHDYRVENIFTAFQKLGVSADVISLKDALLLPVLPTSVRLVWFWRTHHLPSEFAFLRDMTGNRPRIHYDTDDLTFDANAYNVDEVPALRSLPTSILNQLTQFELRKQRLQIEESDSCSGSTSYLVSKLKELCAKSFVVPNVLTGDMLDQLSKGSKEAVSTSRFKILFASGTKTHDEDFKVVWPALLDFMKVHSDVELTFLGASPVKQDEIPVELINRTRFRHLVPHNLILREMSGYDLSLAPLVSNTEFNQAKSAVKILHAAAAGVRSLASATIETTNTLLELESGMVVSSDDNWPLALEKEYVLWSHGRVDRQLLRNNVLKKYTTDRLLGILVNEFPELFNG